MVEQAVILAAGRGTRLQKPDPNVVLDPVTEAIAEQGIKALIPIGGRAYLDYGIERLWNAGICRVCLIVSPGSAALESYAAHLPERFPGLHVDTAVQPEAKGTAHALRFARHAVGSRDLLMLNSDNLYPEEVITALARATGAAAYAVGFEEQALIRGSNFDQARVSRLGVLVPQKDQPDHLERVVEKPDDPTKFMADGCLWITMNIWRFPPIIFEFCDAVRPSPRGEFEITSAVQDMIESGLTVEMLRVRAGVLDLTSRADIPRLQSILPPPGSGHSRAETGDTGPCDRPAPVS